LQKSYYYKKAEMSFFKKSVIRLDYN